MKKILLVAVILLITSVLCWVVILGEAQSSQTPQSLDDVYADKKLFNDIYFLNSQYDISAYGKDIAIEWYRKYKEFQFYDNLADSIVVLKSNNQEVKLPISGLGSFMSLDKRCFIPNTKKKIICVYNPSGGNGWNANHIYAVSLQDEDFFKKLGEVSDINDVDKDGFDDLIIYEDVWEMGLGILSHASSPGVSIILKIEKGKIVPDIDNNINFYQNEIKRIDAEIKKLPREVSYEEGYQLLSLSLEKFLIYRLLANTDKGWDEFNKDMTIGHYGYRFLDSKKRIMLFEEIKTRMYESLRSRRELQF